MNDQFLTELQNVMGGSGIFMEEPMKKHTTFRVGGPADVLVQPDETALAAILALCRQYHVSYSFIGNGSNLLVGDKGIRGVVIEMTDPMGTLKWMERKSRHRQVRCFRKLPILRHRMVWAAWNLLPVFREVSAEQLS